MIDDQQFHLENGYHPNEAFKKQSLLPGQSISGVFLVTIPNYLRQNLLSGKMIVYYKGRSHLSRPDTNSAKFVDKKGVEKYKFSPNYSSTPTSDDEEILGTYNLQD